MLPSSRPKRSEKDIRALLAKHGVTDAVAIVGVRGYYLDTMGRPGVNDRGIYDDAMFVVAPSCFVSFNANTDPSVHRKGIAVLMPGVHRYKLGRHGISRGAGYPALRPATLREELPVMRDGTDTPTVGVAINIHRGGRNTTSSLGCQTVHPSQWAAFISLVTDQMRRCGQRTVPYLLTEETKS